MVSIATTEWLTEAVKNIPLITHDLADRLWAEGRLVYTNGESLRPDNTDLTNSRLVASSIEQGKSLLIILPDNNPRRAPFLFSTALLTHWWECNKRGIVPRDVVYFGSTIGIRDHLSHVKVRSLSLDSVFPQSRSGPPKRTISPDQNSWTDSANLPTVICVYSPSDPISVLRMHRPAWIGIDCGQDSHIRWLIPLLKYCGDAKVPIIAWTSNPLSDSIRTFKDAGIKIFHWPMEAEKQHRPDSTDGLQSVRIAPILIEEDDEFQKYLRVTYFMLARGLSKSGSIGRLGQDALKLAWSLQRSLEGLSVPLDLYEAEALHYWGIRRISALHQGLERFIPALKSSYPELYLILQEASENYATAIKLLTITDTPLWSALTKLCVEDIPVGISRILVFPSSARKQIFALGLLARYNISEDDLSGLRVQLNSVKDFQERTTRKTRDFLPLDSSHSPYSSANNIIKSFPMLIGLPSPLISPRLFPLLTKGTLEVLTYQYQAPALRKRAQEWTEALTPDIKQAIQIIVGRRGNPPTKRHPTINPTVTLVEPLMLLIDSTKETKLGPAIPESRKGILEQLDTITEIERLLEDEDDPEVNLKIQDDGESEEETIFIDQGLLVQFLGGWRIIFLTDEQVNFIARGPTGERVEQRYVRSLRPSDKILFVHGQKRQSLYELIVSRVHGHPAMQVHLALIDRWQKDLLQAFGERRRNGWEVDNILGSLQALGSNLTSPQTIRLWLQGRVLCPDDPQDLRRLATVMDLTFVQQYYQRIFKAAQRIRGLHIGLSIRLNKWLQSKASGITHPEHSFEVFDVELGLSLQDFQDSLTILEVKSIKTVHGPFLRSSLGVLERE